MTGAIRTSLNELIARAMGIHGWYSERELAALYWSARGAQAVGGIFVEVGSHAGRSAYILSEVQRVYCIDPWTDEAAERVFDRELGHRAVFKRKDYDFNVKEIRNVSFLHLDHEHTYHAVRRSLLHWLPFLRSQAIVAVHDYVSKGKRSDVKRAVDETELEFMFKAESLGIFLWP